MNGFRKGDFTHDLGHHVTGMVTGVESEHLTLASPHGDEWEPPSALVRIATEWEREAFLDVLRREWAFPR
ncbi:hypothetical protein E0L36_15385 [Streptomyces sp. AJS327]|uniref:hypothetical protein n=1 Tax=Streptomyces sp. AJS327 TaxID=2545265 RepID=UPI0015DE9363|nr:hypothetical protein [Streptomyces sp. AJS327]MBA0052236.1 hypothetical protein [Streptomyces sp. AJS327]